MKKVLLALSLLLLLTSCGANQEDVVVSQSSNVDTVQGEIAQEDASEEMPVEADVPTAEVYSFDSIVASISSERRASESFNYCMASSVDSCISESFYQTGNEVSCDEYITVYNKQNCEENKKIAQAKESNDITICDTLSYNQQGCVMEVVVAQGLTSLDVSVCEEVDEMFKVECNNTIVKAKAMSEKDAAVCNAILGYSEGDTYEQEYCRQEVEYSLQMEALNTAQNTEAMDDMVLPEAPMDQEPAMDDTLMNP